jgi:sec-independent protein translocase protein TatC
MSRVRRVRPDDQLTLVEHLDELRWRVVMVLTVLVVAIGVSFWKSSELLRYLASPLPHSHGHPFKFLVTAPTEGFMTTVTISLYAGILLALPVATYQLYAFVIPAFSEEQHKNLRPLLMLVPGLFIGGVAFGWFLVMPPALHFLVNYNDQAFRYQLKARDYVQFTMLTLGAMGIVFELPVVMLVLGRIGIVTSEMMRRHWRIAVVVLAFVAVLLPGTDPVTMIVEYIPLLVLYALSYFLVRLVERARDEEEPEVWPTP